MALIIYIFIYWIFFIAHKINNALWGKFVKLRDWTIDDLCIFFTPQPLRAVGVLFSPMVSRWAGGRKKFVRAVSQKP